VSEPRAKKSLGQHFLRNEGVVRQIIDLIQPSPSDQILEIGPGPGALTAYLREKPHARLLLIEKDDYWASHHAALSPADGREKVIHGDALSFRWEELVGSWKIVGNLPYNVASPLMWDIVAKTPDLSRAVFMVQKEVAERLCASPGGHAYGALSVWIQSFASVQWGFTVKPGSFSPPPKVDSAVVLFSPLRDREPFDALALARVLKLCFGQRRKQLQRILRHCGFTLAENILDGLAISPTARPETISPKKFQQLAALLFSSKIFSKTP